MPIPETILDHPILSARYFFPRRDPLANPFLVEVEGATLACHYEETDPGARTLVHFHGNGEVAADYLHDFVGAMTHLGWNVFLAEYRGYGTSTGTPSLGVMLEDVAGIFEALGRNESDLVVYGRSVGSIYALEWAHRYPGIAGLILESGIADVLERILLRVTPEELGTGREDLETAVANRLDHRAKLRRFEGPTLVIHAADDDLVPPSHGRRLHEWSGAPPEHRILFDQGGHNGVISRNWSAYLQVLERFLGSV